MRHMWEGVGVYDLYLSENKYCTSESLATYDTSIGCTRSLSPYDFLAVERHLSLLQVVTSFFHASMQDMQGEKWNNFGTSFTYS